jgi:hypothetical protein
MIFKKIIIIYNDIPILANKITVIYNKFPIIRNTLKRLAVNLIIDTELFNRI